MTNRSWIDAHIGQPTAVAGTIVGVEPARDPDNERAIFFVVKTETGDTVRSYAVPPLTEDELEAIAAAQELEAAEAAAEHERAVEAAEAEQLERQEAAEREAAESQAAAEKARVAAQAAFEERMTALVNERVAAALEAAGVTPS